MEPATILVLVLCAGGVALLVWFAINSRRNEASKKQMSTHAQPDLSPLKNEAQSKVESDIEKKRPHSRPDNGKRNGVHDEEKSQSIVVSDADMDRLSRLVRALKHSLFRDQLQLESLDKTLESAEVTSSERIPRDIIRINSRIHVLDLDTGKKERYTLVFPEQADISTNRISVLAPVGIALLGHKSGEVIEARVPGRTRRLRVEQVRFRCETRKRSIEDRARGLTEPLAS